MVRRSLSDPVWEELQDIMKKRAVKARKIIATSWKLFYGNLEQVLLGEMSQKNSVLGRQFIIVFF